MKQYKIDTGLFATNGKLEFETEQEAWDTLRLLLPDKYGTLYVREDVKLPILNRAEYLEGYYSKYGSWQNGAFTPTTTDPSTASYWRPVFIGVTSDHYQTPEEDI